MARQPMTLEEIRAARPRVDPAKIAATTDKDIRRHQIEDGEDPDAPLPPFRPMPDVRAIRTQLRMRIEAQCGHPPHFSRSCDSLSRYSVLLRQGRMIVGRSDDDPQNVAIPQKPPVSNQARPPHHPQA